MLGRSLFSEVVQAWAEKTQTNYWLWHFRKPQSVNESIKLFPLSDSLCISNTNNGLEHKLASHISWVKSTSFGK